MRCAKERLNSAEMARVHPPLEFMAKLPFTTREARSGLTQLYQLVFGLIGREAAFLPAIVDKQDQTCSIASTTEHLKEFNVTYQ